MSGLTAAEIRRSKAIRRRMGKLDDERQVLQAEATDIMERCGHPKLPDRVLGEEYMDTCPDCGFTSYCYAV